MPGILPQTRIIATTWTTSLMRCPHCTELLQIRKPSNESEKHSIEMLYEEYNKHECEAYRIPIKLDIVVNIRNQQANDVGRVSYSRVKLMI